MFKLICVTDRRSCRGDLIERIDSIAAAGIDAVILREKDMEDMTYGELFGQVSDVCAKYGVTAIAHSHTNAAKSVRAQYLHLPLPLLRQIPDEDKTLFCTVGTSCHSIAELREARQAGADCIIAGHIYDTGCKPGIPARGLDFLRGMCEDTDAPVYAIGGIKPENIAEVKAAGAAGACIMSSLMICPDPAEFVRRLRCEVN